MSRDQPLAEIIGTWTRTACPPGCHTRWVNDGKTLYREDPPEPTIDELIVWLRNTGRFVSVVAVAGTDDCVATLKHPRSTWRRGRGIRRSTMLEALQVAVREVVA